MAFCSSISLRPNNDIHVRPNHSLNFGFETLAKSSSTCFVEEFFGGIRNEFLTNVSAFSHTCLRAVPLLNPRRIPELAADAAQLHLEDSRSVLLGALCDIRGSLAQSAIPQEQLLLDLHALNRMPPKNTTDECHLEIWLSTAIHLHLHDPRSDRLREWQRLVREARERYQPHPKQDIDFQTVQPGLEAHPYQGRRQSIVWGVVVLGIVSVFLIVFVFIVLRHIVELKSAPGPTPTVIVSMAAAPEKSGPNPPPSITQSAPAPSGVLSGVAPLRTGSASKLKPRDTFDPAEVNLSPK